MVIVSTQPVVHLALYVCVRVCVYKCVHMHVEARGQPPVSFFRHHPPRHVDWSLNPRNPPASDFSALGLQMFRHAQRFHTDSGDQTGPSA